MEIRRVRPDEYEEAGRVTALAYREHDPSTSADPSLREDEPDVHAWEEYFQRLADVASRDALAPVLVAVEDGGILGSLTLELEQRIGLTHGPLSAAHAHVRMLGVDPAARARGVGRALMDAAIALARAEGKTILTLNTTQRMTDAQRLYASMGFKREPDEVMPDGFVLLAYSLTLSEAPAGTNSPVVSSTPSSYSVSTKPPRNCC